MDRAKLRMALKPATPETDMERYTDNELLLILAAKLIAYPVLGWMLVGWTWMLLSS